MKKFISSLISVALLATTLVMPMSASADTEDYSDHAKIAAEDINPNRFKAPINAMNFTNRNSKLASIVANQGRWAQYTVDNSQASDSFVNEGTYFSKWTKTDEDTAANFNWTTFEGNTNYVYSVEAKNMSAEGITPRFGYAQFSTNAAGTKVVDYKTFDVTSREGQMLTVTLSTDATGSAGSMGFPNGYRNFGVASNPKTADGSVVYVNMDTMYIGIEQAAEVTNEAFGSPIVTAGGSLEAKASMLNQCGDVGKLDQSFTYMALDADRTGLVENIDIVPGENGAYTINVAESVPAGDYVILARSGLSTEDKLMQKGLTISVINPESMDWEDHAKIADEDVNPNRFKAPIGGNNFTNRNSGLADVVANVDRWARYTVDNSKAGDSFVNEGTYFSKWTKTDEATAANFNWTEYQPNTNYVYSVEAKNMSADGITPRFGFAQFYSDENGSPKADYKTFDVTSRESQMLTVTLSTGATAGLASMGFPNGYKNLGVASNPKTADGSVVYVNMDTMYIGVEQYAEITNVLPEEIEVGESAKGKVEVLNQAGDKGKLGQDYELIVLNADRTDIASGVIVEKGENGEYTVSVDADAASGNYVVLATAKDSDVVLQKGATFEVINLAEMDLTDKAKIPQDQINPNRFKLPATSSHFTSANSHLATKSTSGNWATYTYKSSETPVGAYGAEGTIFNNWAKEQNKDPAPYYNWVDFQPYTDYVYSFEVKNMSAEGITPKFAISHKSKNAAGNAYIYDVASIDVTSREGQMFTVTLSSDGTGGSGNMGFTDGKTWNGKAYPLTAEGSVVYVNMNTAYIGIEQAAEITNVATSSTIVMPGDTISAKTEILNQCGDKGKLSQDGIEFMVLDDERSEIIEDITVTPGANGEYTINVSDSAWAGNYVILAIAEDAGLQLGLNITVVEELEDTAPVAAPANMLKEPNSTYYVNRHGALAEVIAHDDSLGRGKHLAANMIEYTCDASATLYAPAINGSRIEYAEKQINNPALFNWTQFEKDASYLVEIKVQNADTTYEPYFGFVANAVDGTTSEKGYKLEKVTASGDEWQTISTVFTTPVAGSSSSYVMIGYPTGQSAINGETIAPVTGWKVHLDKTATSITKLSPAEVKVTEVAGAEDLTFKAEVINQLGTTQGISKQNFTWFAMNTARTERIEGITLTPNADSTEVTVEFAEDVAGGTYSIVAVANDYGMIKGFDYTKAPEVPKEFAVTGAEYDIGTLTVSCEGIPAAGKTIIVYFAKYLNDVFNGAEIKPIVFDGTNATDSDTVEFTASMPETVKAFIWDLDMNALIETPLDY